MGSESASSLPPALSELFESGETIQIGAPSSVSESSKAGRYSAAVVHDSSSSNAPLSESDDQIPSSVESAFDSSNFSVEQKAHITQELAQLEARVPGFALAQSLGFDLFARVGDYLFSPNNVASKVAESIARRHHFGKFGLGYQDEGFHVNTTEETEMAPLDVTIRMEAQWLEESSTPVEVFEKSLDSVDGSFDFAEFVDKNAIKKCENVQAIDSLLAMRETLFDDGEQLYHAQLMETKRKFDRVSSRVFQQARDKSNPFAQIKEECFINRAAVKVAELNACLTSRDGSPWFLTNHSSYSKVPIVFYGDVCAGPGGFTEYMCTFLKWKIKVFGLTLRSGKMDFQLAQFPAFAPVHTFRAFYGSDCTHTPGDITRNENIQAYARAVYRHTRQHGLHLLTADGGFDFTQNPNVQEHVSQQLFLCQVITAIASLCDKGRFICKVYTTFLPPVVQIIFLCRLCFGRIALVKPNQSRPASSEKYLVCDGFKRKWAQSKVLPYLYRLNAEMYNGVCNLDNDYITSILPTQAAVHMLNDGAFCSYIRDANRKASIWQIHALNLVYHYIKYPYSAPVAQGHIREQSLKEWKLPDIAQMNEASSFSFRAQDGDDHDHRKYCIDISDGYGQKLFPSKTHVTKGSFFRQHFDEAIRLATSRLRLLRVDSAPSICAQQPNPHQLYYFLIPQNYKREVLFSGGCAPPPETVKVSASWYSSLDQDDGVNIDHPLTNFCVHARVHAKTKTWWPNLHALQGKYSIPGDTILDVFRNEKTQQILIFDAWAIGGNLTVHSQPFPQRHRLCQALAAAIFDRRVAIAPFKKIEHAFVHVSKLATIKDKDIYVVGHCDNKASSMFVSKLSGNIPTVLDTMCQILYNRPLLKKQDQSQHN